MIIARATINDLDKIMEIIDEAKEYLKSQNIDQWQDGYPNRDVLANDINNKNLFVVKEDEIMGLFCLSDYEETYDTIYDGKWNSDTHYVVVHRIALENKYKGRGVAKFIFDEIKKTYPYIRVDTHRENLSMQKCLKNNGFKYCGIIYLKRGNAERLAFDYIND